MEQNKKLSTILSDIKEIESIIGYYNSNNNTISSLEIDLIKSKLIEIYSLIGKIATPEKEDEKKETIKSTTPIERKFINPTIKKEVETTVIKEPVPAEIAFNQKDIKSKPDDEPLIIETESTITPNLETESIANTTTKETNELCKEKLHAIPTEKQIIADRFKGEDKNINITISNNKSTSDVAAKLQTKAIQDLTKAFGLNDRFLYTREIFGGDKTKFNNTIEYLNTLSSYDDALEHLQSIITIDSQEVTINFLEILKRRYK